MEGTKREGGIMNGRAEISQTGVHKELMGLFSYYCVVGSTSEPSEGPTYLPATHSPEHDSLKLAPDRGRGFLLLGVN